MALIDNLNQVITSLVTTAVATQDEAAARNNLEALAGIVQGIASELADRLKYSAYNVDGRAPPFQRGK